MEDTGEQLKTINNQGRLAHIGEGKCSETREDRTKKKAKTSAANSTKSSDNQPQVNYNPQW